MDGFTKLVKCRVDVHGGQTLRDRKVLWARGVPPAEETNLKVFIPSASAAVANGG